jgi:hypothetical protein
MVDNIFQPCRSARPDRHNAVAEPLGENSPPTMRDLTDESPRDYPETDLSAGARQISDVSDVSAVDSV